MRNINDEWESRRVLLSDSSRTKPITDSGRLLLTWTSQIFKNRLHPSPKPIMLVSGSLSGTLYDAYMFVRILRFRDQAVRSFSPDFPNINNVGADISDWLEEDKETRQESGLEDGTFFENNKKEYSRGFIVLENIHMLPPDQGMSLYRFLSPRLGLGRRCCPAIIHHPLGIEGMKKQFRKSWDFLEPIFEHYATQLEF